MNDFTKEELQIIVDCVKGFAWDCEANIDTTCKLKAKIQSMIDNYCEHIHGGEAEIFVDVCNKCDSLLPRYKTLGEYNE